VGKAEDPHKTFQAPDVVAISNLQPTAGLPDLIPGSLFAIGWYRRDDRIAPDIG
jgi:hypothetical protein